MPLKYALFPNPLTDDPDDYRAQVQNVQSRTLDDIIAMMIKQGSTNTRADIVSVLEDYRLALGTFLGQGDSINTPLFNLLPSIQGIFHSRDDPFDPAKHQIRLNLNAGGYLRQIVKQIQLQRVGPSTPAPAPLEFEDVSSDTRNGRLTPGGVGKLLGSRLKHDPNDPQQGVFFIDGAGAETRVTELAHNKPSALFFQIPATLAAGTYTLDVRAQVGRSAAVRSGRLPVSLQVF